MHDDIPENTIFHSLPEDAKQDDGDKKWLAFLWVGLYIRE